MAELGPLQSHRPLHRIESIFGQLTKDPLNVAIGGFGFVDLVQSNHDGHASRLGVVDGFHGLWHHTVIGGNHQDDHVGDLSPPVRISVNAS